MLLYLIDSEKQNLKNPAVLSGWFLFGLLILLGTLNVRKKLIAFNLGAVRFWVAFHIVGGLAAVVIFLIHTNGIIFPLGLYEQIIAFLFGSCQLREFLAQYLLMSILAGCQIPVVKSFTTQYLPS